MDGSETIKVDNSITAEALKRASPRARGETALDISPLHLTSNGNGNAKLMGDEMDTLQDSDAQQAGSQVAIQNGPLSGDVMLAQDLEPTLAQARAQAQAQSPDAPPVATVAPPVIPATIGGTAVKTSDTHPINISPIVPTQLMDALANGVYQHIPPKICSQLTATASSALAGPSDRGLQEHVEAQIKGDSLIRVGSTVDLAEFVIAEANATANNGCIPSQTQIQALESAAVDGAGNGTGLNAKIGNLFLSSCPGKKVRLTGPVRGRGAICRDLGLDLKRIQEIGVGAIVCCLDDEELAFLGAPWLEYEKSADSLGIDVIRIPVAEGFAPTSHIAIDRALTTIVMDYSLRGVSVLVHCRGGVGRAGLIACVWMLKMGLIRSSQELHARANGTEVKDADRDAIVVDTVERLVHTIRRRRSPKAIETAEQVKFIVDVSAPINFFFPPTC